MNTNRTNLTVRRERPNMKKIFAFSSVVIFAFALVSCKMYEDEVLRSLGKYEDSVFYSNGEFQDYTDYAKYYYTSANIEDNEYFTRVQKSDMDEIHELLEDFEGWVEVCKEDDPFCELVANYDFNSEMIDTEDYFYIESEEHEWGDGHTSFDKYDIYFWDSQTSVLYYFHNNI